MFKQGLFFLLLLFSALSFASTTSVPPVIVCPGNSGIANSAQFVYCGPAVCATNADGVTATCKGCYTLVGDNVGTLSCADRVPTTTNGVTNYISSFSARKVTVPGYTKQPLVFCEKNSNSDTIYADCLNALCTIIDKKTGESTCQCPLITMKKGESFAMEARSCNTPNRCNAQTKGELLNGAPTPLVLPMIDAIEKETGQTSADLICSSSTVPAS